MVHSARTRGPPAPGIRKVLVSCIIPRHECVNNRVLRSFPKAGLATADIAIVFPERGRRSVFQGLPDEVRRIGASKAVSIPLSALLPLLGCALPVVDSSSGSRFDDWSDFKSATQV